MELVDKIKAMNDASTKSTLFLSVDLDPKTVAHYKEHAARSNEDIATYIGKKLKNTVNYNANKALYINDAQRSKLEKLFGKNFNSADDLVMSLESVLTIDILIEKRVEILLKPNLIQRLRTRCLRGSFESFLQKEIVIKLEEFVGLR